MNVLYIKHFFCRIYGVLDTESVRIRLLSRTFVLLTFSCNLLLMNQFDNILNYHLYYYYLHYLL